MLDEMVEEVLAGMLVEEMLQDIMLEEMLEETLYETRFPARAVGDPQRPRDFSRPWSLAPRGPESLRVRRENSRIGH